MLTVLLLVLSPARAQETPRPEPLMCGAVLTRDLQPGEVDRYQPLIGGGNTVGIVDITDVSGTIGILRILTRRESQSPIDTCGGSTEVAFRESIEVSDCIDMDAGTYAIALNVVTQGPENCGRPLTCGVAVNGALAAPGEVDSYTLSAVTETQVRIEIRDPNAPERQLRVRLYGGDADLIGDSCSGSLEAPIGDSGTQTILVSACDGTSTGGYEIEWRRLPSCGGQAPADEFAHVLNAGGGTMAVIRTASNRLESIVPILSAGNSDPGGVVQASTDGAFVYAGLPISPALSAINTATNRVGAVAAVPSDGVKFALHPNGRFLYASSSAAGGVVVIETAVMRTSATIPLERAFDGAGIAISPDGAKLYVVVGCEPGSCSARIAVIDLVQNAVVGFIDEPRLVRSAEIRISPSGQLAYHFASFNPSILAIDLVARAVVHEIPATAEDIEFSADGTRAYATSTGALVPAGVVVIDTQSHGIVDTIPLPDFERPHGIGVSAATGFLYVTDIRAIVDDEIEQEPGLAVVDPISRTVVALINTFGNNPTDVVLVRAPEGLCAGDEVRESKVTVGELVTSVNFAIDGCPGEQLVEGLRLPAPGRSEASQ